MPTYTPGPWGLCDSSDARSKGYIRQCGQNNVTRSDGMRPAICRITKDGWSSDVARANTRLIEAAPDLADAAREILSAYDQFLVLKSARQAVAFEPKAEAIAALRAALRKVGQ
jgi:hypothetical protein